MSQHDTPQTTPVRITVTRTLCKPCLKFEYPLTWRDVYILHLQSRSTCQRCHQTRVCTSITWKQGA